MLPAGMANNGTSKLTPLERWRQRNGVSINRMAQDLECSRWTLRRLEVDPDARCFADTAAAIIDYTDGELTLADLT